MAAGEVRAAWQRAANRCFVQEDAKRAPRLSRLLDAELCGHTECAAIHPSVSFSPLPSNSNLPPDARWWLHLHPPLHPPPNTSPKKQSSVVSTSVEVEEVENMFPDSSVRNKATNTFTIGTGTSNRGFSMDVLEFSGLKKKLLPEVCHQPWLGNPEKQVLASLVAKGSSIHIENCDLPVSCKRRHGSGNSKIVPTTTHQDGSFYTERTMQSGDVCGFLDSDSCTSQSIDERKWRETQQDCPLHFSSKFSSGKMKDCDGRECSKGWILEALCHSQARAREAEDEAKHAKVEKERVTGLFFRQASVLFAYKQWLHVLQLDILSHQLKAENTSHFVVFFPEPFPPALANGSRKQPKRSLRRRYGFGRRVVALVLGCTLVGAGLLLGWTIGWLLSF